MSLFPNQSPNQGGGGLFGNPASQSPHRGGLFGHGNVGSTQGGGGLFGNHASQGPNRGGLFGGTGNQVHQEQSSRGQDHLYLASPSAPQDLFIDMYTAGSVGSCSNHRNKPLELFCKTDKIKICVNCAYSEGHKGHDIDMIENMRPTMSDKGILYEKSLKKVDDSKSLIFSLIDEKAKPFDQILKDRQRNEEITRLKAWFLIQNYIESQRVNFVKSLDKKSLSYKELKETAQDYQKGNNSGLIKTSSETLEEINMKFDESVFESLCAEGKETIQEQSENLKNELNQIYNQESGDILKVRGIFSLKKVQNHLEFKAKVAVENFELNLSELKEVSSLSIIIETAYFFEQDLNLLRLVLLNLPSLDSLSLQCNAHSLPQLPGLMNGCSIFTHLLQSFQLATNLSLHKLKHFAFVSECKTLNAHDQISQMMLGLTSTMESLKLLKIHFNHLFEDPVQKGWKDLRELTALRKSKEPKQVFDPRELPEQSELRKVNYMIEQKEFDLSKKIGINCTLKIFNILVKNKNLENAELIMPNVEILDFDESFFRISIPELCISISRFLIKAKNRDYSIPPRREESGRGGTPNAQQINTSSAVGTTGGGGLFGNKPATTTEHSGRGGGGLFGSTGNSTVPPIPTEHTGKTGGNRFESANKPNALNEHSGKAGGNIFGSAGKSTGLFGATTSIPTENLERGRGDMFASRSATPTQHSGRGGESSSESRSATPTERFERGRGDTFGSRPTTPTEHSGRVESGNIFGSRKTAKLDDPERTQQGEKKVAFGQGTKKKN